MWAHFEGKARTRAETLARISELKWTDWKPRGITLHNTAAPTLAQWAESGPAHDARIRNLQSYYEGMGWHAGPHFFVSRNWINWFSNPILPGVHSRCFNATRFGIEMVGDYNAEAFNSGDGALVRDNAVFLIAALNLKFGFDPDDLTFHVECKQDNHDCPGRNVVKANVIARVKAEMARQSSGGTSASVPAEPPSPLPAYDAITKLAAAHPAAAHNWQGRGVAPVGYTKGMAVAYGRLYRFLKDGDDIALAMAKADTDNESTDALAHYAGKFRMLGWRNNTTGVDTFRHLFALLWGLGMRESSGRWCEGRDQSAKNTTADNAEAGLFQQSWDSRKLIPKLETLFAEWKKLDPIPGPGLFRIFREGVPPDSAGLHNWGDGEGAEFQRICKSSPFFAVEAALLGLRSNRTHWGPINRMEVELYAPLDSLLRNVQAVIDGATPKLDTPKPEVPPAPVKPSPVKPGHAVGAGIGAAASAYFLGLGPWEIAMYALAVTGLGLGLWAAFKWWRGRS